MVISADYDDGFRIKRQFCIVAFSATRIDDEDDARIQAKVG